MSRRTSQWFAIVSLTLAAFTTACDRVETTAPSEIPAASFEKQGGNN
jgi:hypothetical protein